MEKNKLKKIGVIAIGALTLLSTSLSIAAMVKLSKDHHKPPCPPAYLQEHQDGHKPKGGHGPQEHEKEPDMKPDQEPGSQDQKDKPKGPEDDGKPEDAHDHRPHKKGEHKKDDKPQAPGQNSEDKKEQTK